MRNEDLFKKKDKYRDFDVSFKRNPVTNDVVRLSAIDSIKQSVKLLVMTSFYERPYQPKIGTRVKSSMFGLNDGTVSSSIMTEIKTVLGNYEPRIDSVKVQVSNDGNSVDNNQLKIMVMYRIVGTEHQVNQTINLKRVR